MCIMALAVILFVVLYQRKVIKHHVEMEELNAQSELEILRASIQSEDEERKRISAELHDDIGATLSSAKLFLNFKDGDIGSEQIEISKTLIDESLHKIRLVSNKLRPSSLSALGLTAAVKNMLDLLNKSGQVEATMGISHELPRLDRHTELHVFRLIQEITTNITRHSGAKNISVKLFANQNLNVTISHNGKGITEPEFAELLKSSSGQGLKNLVNRLRIVDGKIYHSCEGDIFKTEITIPLTHEKAKN